MAPERICAWCYSQVVPQASEDSVTLGLNEVGLWACAQCIQHRSFNATPRLWEGNWRFTEITAYWLDGASLLRVVEDQFGGPSIRDEFELLSVGIDRYHCVEITFRWSLEPGVTFGFRLAHDWLVADNGLGTGLQALPRNTWLAVMEETDTGIVARGRRVVRNGTTWIVGGPFGEPCELST